MGPEPSKELLALAGALGVETGYWDMFGTHHRAGTDVLLAVLGAMGVDVDAAGGPAPAAAQLAEVHGAGGIADPVVVWPGEAAEVIVAVPHGQVDITVTVDLEGGGERATRAAVAELAPAAPPAPAGERRGETWRRLTLPGPWPVGYHELVVRTAAGDRRATVVAAPDRVAGLAPHDRLWGVLVPVYAPAGGAGLGAHVGVLGEAADAIDGLGGKIVATLPLLASYLGVPFDPSPYAPVSRRGWNELYVDLAALPELAAVPAAVENLAGLASFGHAANIRSRHFDYRHQYGYVRGVLEQVVGSRDDWPKALADDFAAFVAARPVVGDYARFRAFADARGSGWHAWPEPQRSGKVGAGDVDDEVVAVHAFGQFAMARQLGALGERLAGRGQRLYLDLPVGANGDGFDTWRERDLFAWGVGAGAPPDDFFADGQNWGFPPLNPMAPGDGLLRHHRDVLRHHMGVAGILRLDHAMSLERLFWVPDGASARDGVYVRYPRDALLAVLAVESHRHDCVVVGEDLGTVSDAIREAMSRRGLLGMYVSQFNQPAWDGAALDAPRPDQLASIDTHDTPTFAGWLHGLDVDERHVLGHVDDAGAERARDERRAQVHNLVAFLTHRGDVVRGTVEEDERAVLEGLLRFLGDSDAPAVLVGVDDLTGERNPQNVPGTTVDRPNWVQRIRLSAAELGTDADVVALLEVLQGCRLGSYLRSSGPSAAGG